MTWKFRPLTKSHSAKSQKNGDLKFQDSRQCLHKTIKGYSLDIVPCLNTYLFIYDLRTLSAAWTIQPRMVGRIGMNVTRICRGVITLIVQKAEHKSETLPTEPTCLVCIKTRSYRLQKVSVPAVVQRARLTTQA